MLPGVANEGDALRSRSPSGAGKSVSVQNMILDVFSGCFSRVYMFSPGVDIDQTWDPVKKIYKMKSNQMKFYKIARLLKVYFIERKLRAN